MRPVSRVGRAGWLAVETVCFTFIAKESKELRWTSRRKIMAKKG
jgi:hypothetical protein